MYPMFNNDGQPIMDNAAMAFMSPGERCYILFCIQPITVTWLFVGRIELSLLSLL